MALSILDGNQSATTLSTILSSGQHITAHTVISLGTQAITDMRSAVSGSVVSISNFPASQSTTFGAVTGSVSVLNFPASQAVTFSDASLTNTQLRASAVTVGGTVTVGNSLTISSLPVISGTVTAMAGTNFSDEISDGIFNYTGNYEFFPILGTVTIGNTVTIAGTVTANPTGTQTIAGSVTIGAGTAQIGSVTASISGTVPISISSVTVGNSVTIGSLPAISGTVTANLSISSTAITSGSFTSLTSATLVPANTARKMATVYNLGAGQLFINAGATATTLGGGFMVALSSGDFYECDYTTTTLSAIFATAGTASWVSH